MEQQYMTRLAETYVPILASGVFKDSASIL